MNVVFFNNLIEFLETCGEFVLFVDVLQDFVADTVDLQLDFLSLKKCLFLLLRGHCNFTHSIYAIVHAFLQITTLLTHYSLLELINQTLQLVPVLRLPLNFLAQGFPDKEGLRGIFQRVYCFFQT